MLCLSRKEGESVIIDRDMKVSVLRISPSKVRLGFEGPDEVMREEVLIRLLAGEEPRNIEDDLDRRENQ